MPTTNEMIDFCEDMAAYDCFSNEQFARREMFYAISDELKKALREQKRPHGEWLSHYEYCKKHDCIPSGLIAFWWCNKCEQGVEIATNFCPNCGADMRRKSGEQNDG